LCAKNPVLNENHELLFGSERILALQKGDADSPDATLSRPALHQLQGVQGVRITDDQARWLSFACAPRIKLSLESSILVFHTVFLDAETLCGTAYLL
jgi:hypothetical protein